MRSRARRRRRRGSASSSRPDADVVARHGVEVRVAEVDAGRVVAGDDVLLAGVGAADLVVVPIRDRDPVGGVGELGAASRDADPVPHHLVVGRVGAGDLDADGVAADDVALPALLAANVTARRGSGQPHPDVAVAQDLLARAPDTDEIAVHERVRRVREVHAVSGVAGDEVALAGPGAADMRAHAPLDDDPVPVGERPVPRRRAADVAAGHGELGRALAANRRRAPGGEHQVADEGARSARDHDPGSAHTCGAAVEGDLRPEGLVSPRLVAWVSPSIFTLRVTVGSAVAGRIVHTPSK